MRRWRSRPWLRGLRPRCKPVCHSRGVRSGSKLWIATILGILLALLAIRLCDSALQPTVAALAESKAKNIVTLLITDTAAKTLSSGSIAYDDIVTLQKDTMGHITAMSTSSVATNALRTQLLGDIVEQVKILDSSELNIPLGNLTGLLTLSDRGPQIPIRILNVASANATFSNTFTSAGINQTLHQIFLDITVTVKLLLPGGTLEVPVSAQINVCETVIVGDVPNAYLQLTDSKPKRG